MQTIRVINYHGLSTELPAVWIDALERAGILRVLSRAGGQEGHTAGASYDVLEFPPPADLPPALDGERPFDREWANVVSTYLDDELNINAVDAPEWTDGSALQSGGDLVEICFDIARSQLQRRP